MHLKSLTMKGFKSFASATTLRFEPGITAVVGPNGSGKSNVVDAIAWVLGEQGAKALRGGKMDDVIFAGTADRPPLGRAEVTLTIDNSDGALPVDYAEVSITRRMFRDGAGEYEINGSSCRLLDIQELLSDSGIGREMHVIVGQGQLDAVLSARPEDRRAFIEEAAGVLKHRKRKERAQRRLESSQANLDRLSDLTGEIRRQLGPLGRQAAVARRAAGVQADLRDARMRLLADDIAQLTDQIARDAVDEQSAVDHRSRVQHALAQASAEQEFAGATLRDLAPQLQQAQDAWFALSALAERFRGTISLAQERARNLSAPLADGGTGRDPDELDAAAERAEAEHAALQDAMRTAQDEVQDAADRRAELERELRAAEDHVVAASRLIADRREGLARLAGQVHAARSRLAAADDEVDRLAAAVDDAAARTARASAEFDALQGSAGDLDTSEVGLDEAHEAATAAVAASRARVAHLTDAIGRARTDEAGLRARVDALMVGLRRKDGAGALLSAGDALPGVVGSVAAGLCVAPGFEAAVAAALGAIADAVAVHSTADAAAALRLLRNSDAGRAGMLVQGARSMPDRREWPGVPDAVHWATDLITAPDRMMPALARALDRVAVVDDLATAVDVVGRYPDVRAVTRDGDLVGPDWAIGGTAGNQSMLEVQAAVDVAAGQLERVRAQIGDDEAALAGARADAERRERDAARALAALHESDAHMSAVAEELGRHAATAASARAEADRLDRRRTAAEASRVEHRTALADLEARLHAVRSEDVPEAVDAGHRDVLADRTAVARQREVEARLTLRSAEERVRAAGGSAESLRRAARQERAHRATVATSARRRAAGAAVAARVVDVAAQVARRLEASLADAARRRENAIARRTEADTTLAAAHARSVELQVEWDALTDAVHAGEVARAQQTLRLEQLCGQALTDFAVSADDLVDGYGPVVPVPPTIEEMAEVTSARERGEAVTEPPPMPYDRATQQRRAKRAERDLNTLGKVNPLALEEFAALEERHAFLSTQLEDLKATRRDLLSVIRDVDGKILELFAVAYQDVAREFVTVFATLFPGGEGELVLTDPADMLATGIEVHARPPGKKVKRLSLLSGGERSLTAVALLVAIFRARPSPFYIMDEVEAALDEVNLARLVELLTELRDSSQLIIITHQKFTMESADALYGVSMRGDGITTVISQRMRDRDGPSSEPGASERAGSGRAEQEPIGATA